MGRRGPLPKPTKLKELEGNPGKRPLPTNEPEPTALVEIPPPPTWLPPIAQQCWRTVGTELVAAGMLAKLDLHILELLCVSYAHWRQMLRGIRRVGFTARYHDKDGNERYATPTPEALLAIKYAAEVNRWAKVMGLGIAYRVGLHIGDKGKGSSSDPIADILKGNAPPSNTETKSATKPTSKSVSVAKVTRKRAEPKAPKRAARKSE